MTISRKIALILNFFINKFKELQKNKWLGRVLLFFSYVYPIVLIYLSWEEIREIKWDSLIENFLLSFLFYTSSLLLQSMNWTVVVNGNLCTYLQDSEIYFRSLLMRRLPGGFWHWLGRINLYASSDLRNKERIVKANFYEWWALSLTGFTFYLLITHYLAGTIAYVVLFLFLFSMKIKRQQKTLIEFLWNFGITIAYMLCWFLGGVIIQILSTNLNNSRALTLLTSCKTWALTGAFGTLTFFLPSGLFIRELSFTALLSPVLEFSEIIFLALLVRLLFTIGDIIGSTAVLVAIKLIIIIKSKNKPILPI